MRVVKIRSDGTQNLENTVRFSICHALEVSMGELWIAMGSFLKSHTSMWN